jgi:hypothetical protein
MLLLSESIDNDNEVPIERESVGAKGWRFLLKRKLPLASAQSRDKDAPVAAPVNHRRWFGRRPSLGGGYFPTQPKNTKQTKLISHPSTMFNYTEDDDDNVGLLGTFGSSGESDYRPAARRSSLLQFFGTGRRASTSNIPTKSRTKNKSGTTTETVWLDMETLTSAQLH